MIWPIDDPYGDDAGWPDRRELHGPEEDEQDPGDPEGPDWRVATICDHGPAVHYRYSITGINYSHDPPQAFSWSVPSLLDPRYDMSGAKRT